MLALLLAVAHATSSDDPVPMIWSGDLALDEDLRAVVALRAARRSGPGVSDAFCSGTLIDPSWVLTAAHCVGIAENAREEGLEIEVVTGVSRPYTSRTTVDELIPHPSYDAEGGAGTGFDLALLHLAEPIDDIPPMPVSARRLDGSWAGLPVTVVGYGRTGSEADDTGTRRLAELVYVGTSLDLLQLTSGSVKWSDRYDAYEPVGDDAGTNACNGDSGGATLVALPDGGHVLVGTTVVVYGGCEGGSTGSTELDGYLGWITEHAPGTTVVTDPQPGAIDLVDLDEGGPVGTSGAAQNASAGGCDTTSGVGASTLLGLFALLVRRRGARSRMAADDAR